MRSVNYKPLIILLLLLKFCCVNAADNGVILMYHHVSEDTPAITSISPKKFTEHLEYLAEHHTVLPLQTMIRSLRNGKAIPNKSVAITFDDGFSNLYRNALPILRRFNFPFTIFINPSLIGQPSYQLTWQEIKEMQRYGGSFANHGLTHDHMLMRLSGETKSEWLDRVLANIEQAEQLIKQELGYSLRYLAYPYGEFDHALKARLAEKGYVGFAQHSGAIASYSDYGALPRFPAAGVYSNLDTLAVKLNSLAMPVTVLAPKDTTLAFEDHRSHFVFELQGNDILPAQVQCFHLGEPLSVKIGKNKYSVSVPTPIPVGRTRINCTAASIRQADRFYWYSQPWFKPNEAGTWLD